MLFRSGARTHRPAREVARALALAPVPRGAPRLLPPRPARGSHGARPRPAPSSPPPRPLANMALVPCQVLRVAILLSYCSILCNYKAIEMPSHQTYGGSWKFLTFIDLVRPPPSPTPSSTHPEPACVCGCAGICARAAGIQPRPPFFPSDCVSKAPQPPQQYLRKHPALPGSWGTSADGSKPGGGLFGGEHTPASKRCLGKILLLANGSDDLDQERPETHSTPKMLSRAPTVGSICSSWKILAIFE